MMYDFKQSFQAYAAARDAGADFSEYDADRIEYRKTTPADAQAIAAEATAIRRAIAKRQEVERKVVRRAVRALIAAGYHVGVFDGESVACQPTQKVTTVMANIGACDEEWLRVRVPSETEPGKWRAVGSVMLVYGNDGWDVIGDYSMSLDEVLTPVMDYAEGLSA